MAQDGNKRIAFVAMYTFLGLNGWELEVSHQEAIKVMLSLASGQESEEDLAIWLRDHLQLLEAF